MKSAVMIVRDGNAIAFSLLAFLCLRRWRQHPTDSAGWAAAAFCALAGAAVTGIAASGQVPGHFVIVKLTLAALVCFPYFLYRFASTFHRSSRVVEAVAAVPTALAIGTALAIHSLARTTGPRPPLVTLFLATVLVQWTVLFTIIARRLWLAGRHEATVARRRMRSLAVAGVGLIIAVMVTFFARLAAPSVTLLVARLLASMCALLFFLALFPPRWLLYLSRRREMQASGKVLPELLRVTTSSEVSEVVLPLTAIVGVRAAAIVALDGRVLATHGPTPPPEECAVLARTSADAAPDGIHTLAFRTGIMVLWMSPYAPFFGRDELAFVRQLGGLADIAIERCDLIEQQRSFIANAAHELRTPLTSILGFSLTLGRDGHRLSPGEYDMAVAAMQRQGDRVRLLIDNLLDLAQLDSGKVLIRSEPVRIAEAVRRAVAAVPAPEGTRIEADVDERLIALADAERLEQVLVNLLVNAYRHGQGPVRVETRGRDDSLVISVRDAGAGVPAEFAPHLFDAFTRGPNAARTGSGLGLSISRRIVEALGGEMWYEPNMPRGAAFNIRLQRLADEATDEAPISATA